MVGTFPTLFSHVRRPTKADEEHENVMRHY